MTVIVIPSGVQTYHFGLGDKGTRGLGDKGTRGQGGAKVTSKNATWYKKLGIKISLSRNRGETLSSDRTIKNCPW